LVKQKALPKSEALRVGEKVTRTTLSASFKVVKSNKMVRRTDESFTPSPDVFRSYRIVKGRKIPLMDEFIQRREKRLGTRPEVFEIQKARRSRLMGGTMNGQMGIR